MKKWLQKHATGSQTIQFTQQELNTFGTLYDRIKILSDTNVIAGIIASQCSFDENIMERFDRYKLLRDQKQPIPELSPLPWSRVTSFSSHSSHEVLEEDDGEADDEDDVDADASDRSTRRQLLRKS